MSQTDDQSPQTDHKPEERVNGQTEDEDLVVKWGFDDWTQLYRIALKFFKDNESKAFHPSYDTRNQLFAYILQEKYGKFDPSKAKPLGPLDIIGKDRRNSWISLTTETQLSAQKGFIKLLNDLCPLFEPYVKANKVDIDEKLKLRQESEELERKRIEELKEKERIELETKRKEEEEVRQREEQKRAIQEALNRQTYQQFKTYAEQQYPGNTDLQNSLISQLQEQHYQQYLLQIREQQSIRSSMNPTSNSNRITSSVTNQTTSPLNTNSETNQSMNNSLNQTVQLERQSTPEEEQQNNHLDQTTTASESISDSDDESVGPIAGASMWTRKDIALFKESIRSEGGDGIIKVGHGEIVTVRVPTHKDGTCIFWEFATDSYDIGFGLLFEWTKNPGNQVSVHISESEDEDEDEEEGDVSVGNDVEKGNAIDSEKESLSPKTGQTESSPISVIIPIYRRDSHEEVFAGSHAYPGKGVYLLKFDNSYSLWRSKTLYYRVYYTR